MSFTAKVKTTGKIFEATDELGENDIRAWDAKALEQGKRYKGYLYDTQPTDDPAEFNIEAGSRRPSTQMNWKSYPCLSC